MRNVDLILLTLIASVVGNASQAYAQITQNDSLAIIESSLNYVEGWYEGDAERMKRGLHPDLAKRSVYTHPKSGRSIIRHIGASSLVEITRAGGGKESREKHIKNGSQVIILDVFQNIATVRGLSVDFVDYLHLAKYDGTWLIVNILWDRPRTSKQ